MTRFLKPTMLSKIERIEKLKHVAEDAYNKDRMVSVVELLKLYLKYFPNDGWAWFLYGDAQRVLGKIAAATVSLRNAERLCPPEQKWTVESRLGLLFHDSGHFVAAEDCYVQALAAEEARNETWLWIFRGVNFAAQELLDEAEKCYRRAIAINEKDEEAFFDLAVVYRNLGRYDEAKSAAETALAICSDYAEAMEVLLSLEGATESRALVDRLRRLDATGDGDKWR